MPVEMAKNQHNFCDVTEWSKVDTDRTRLQMSSVGRTGKGPQVRILPSHFFMKTPEDRIISYLRASQLCALMSVVKPLHAAIILILTAIVEWWLNWDEIKERRDERIAKTKADELLKEAVS